MSARLLERDAGLLWHPYAPLDGGALFAVTGASGPTLTLDDGAGRHTVIDGMASWWSAVHGYGHPALDAAAARQLGDFSHVMFGGLTHAPAVELAERLVRIAPEGLEHVFLADSGSVSVEVALKAAVQYQAASGRPGRQRFLSIRGGYHGDTFAAMSVCDPVDGMHAAFPGLVAGQVHAPRPPAARLRVPEGQPLDSGAWEYDAGALAAWAADLERLAGTHEAELAAIVVEPVLQGAGGMHVYPPEALRILRRAADRHGLLLIVDEIATGFGRTGKLFASDWAGVVPDIMCVGKALTGGYLSLAAVLCHTRVAAALSGSEHGAILHGPTFMGNPLACAVAAASLDLLAAGEPEPAWRESTTALHHSLTTALRPASGLRSVIDVRVLGGVGVVELDRPVDVVAVTRAAVRHGAWVRPFRNLVYVMPPYVCVPEDIAVLGAAVTAAIAEVHDGAGEDH